MIKIFLLLFFSLFTLKSFSQSVTPEYYLPQDVTYDTSISLPKEILGHEIGEMHVTHDKLVYYLQHLASQSNRIQIETYGHTHEKRPLLLLTISSEKNLFEQNQIKNSRTTFCNGELAEESLIDSLPVIVWMGFSVHGNEPSGSNSALLLAYYLAAAQGDKIDELLDSSIILIDPCTNPDGLQRFSGWVNANMSKNQIGDINNREYHEPWPQGRTNHYWFDLNRDWLLLQQPESKARIAKYHEWKPNVVTDHHEMGINSTLFFQPGVPSRNHPLTPSKNEVLTNRLSDYHIASLDHKKELYFTKESFDDFYYGKGSTYPDLQGAVGILFEQASTRGLLRETDNGTRDFASTIKNQLTVSLSTLEGSLALKTELLSYQHDFYIDAINSARRSTEKAYVFGDPSDHIKTNKLAELLIAHKIVVHQLKNDLVINNKKFNTTSSYIIPLEQSQHLLIKALFEKRVKFEDSLFYDISSWSMDQAFGLNFEPLNEGKFKSHVGERVLEIEYQKDSTVLKSNYAYAIKWGQYYAPAALYFLQENGIKIKVSEAEFIDPIGNAFPIGTLLILLGIQERTGEEIHGLLKTVADKYTIKIESLESGSNPKGIDLGSPKVTLLKKPKILLLTGEGINANEAGEIWHLMDFKMDIPVTLVSIKDFENVKLSNYTTILVSDGNISSLSSAESLKNWLIEGGILIAQNDALRWLKNSGIYLGNFKPLENHELLDLPYNKRSEYKGAQNMAGAIFQTNIDRSHPICYGLKNDQLAVFKNSKIWLDRSPQSFNNPIVFSTEPLISGYLSSQNLENLQNTAGVSVLSYGEGKVIAFSFNPNFRGFWYGTEKIFLNSIFFGQMIKTQL